MVTWASWAASWTGTQAVAVAIARIAARVVFRIFWQLDTCVRRGRAPRAVSRCPGRTAMPPHRRPPLVPGGPVPTPPGTSPCGGEQTWCPAGSGQACSPGGPARFARGRTRPRSRPRQGARRKAGRRPRLRKRPPRHGPSGEAALRRADTSDGGQGPFGQLSEPGSHEGRSNAVRVSLSRPACVNCAESWRLSANHH